MSVSRTLAAIGGLGAAALVAYLLVSSASDPPRAPRPREPSPATIPESAPDRPGETPAARDVASAPSAEVEPAAAQAPDSPPAAAAPARGAIVGRLLDPEGRPLGDARVRLRPSSARFRGSPISTSSTDESGRFRFDGLEPAELTLTARHPEFQRLTVGSVKVRAGEETDVGDRRLRSGASLSGTVADADGVPVAGATVRLGGRGLFDSDTPEPVTDTSGAFRFAGLAAGTYTLRGDAPGFAPGHRDDVVVAPNAHVEGCDVVLARGLSILGQVLDPSGEPVASASVQASPGREGFLPVRGLRPRSATTDGAGRFEIRDVAAGPHELTVRAEGFATGRATAQAGDPDVAIRLVRPGTISGRVLDAATGAPVRSFRAWAVEGAERFVAVFGDLEARSAGPSPAVVEDSSDGSFTIEGLDPGVYPVRVRAAGYAEGQSEPVTVPAAPEIASAEVHLARGGSIHGVVVEEGTERPIPGVSVSAVARRGLGGDRDDLMVIVSGLGMGERDDLFGAVEATCTTGADGRFSLHDLRARTYRLRARHPDRARAEVPGVDVRAGEATGPVTIALGSAGGVEGYVTGVDGSPQADVPVTARTVKGFSQTARTDEEGYYALRHLTPGTYYVQRQIEESAQMFGAVAMVAADGPHGGPRITPEGTPVEVVADRMARLDFSDAHLGAIAGTLVDGNRPVEGAIVELRSKIAFSLPKTARTDEEGRFDFDRLEPGDFFLAVRILPDPREVMTETVTVDAGRRIEKTLRLPMGSIEGIVRDRLSHEPLEGALLDVEPLDERPEDGRPVAMISVGETGRGRRTGRDGRFRIPYLRPGRYRVAAAKEGFGQGSSQPVAIAREGDRASDIEIQLAPGGALTGRIVDGATGAPVPDAMVRGRDAAGRSLLLSEFVHSDRDGRFRLNGLPAGLVSLEVFAPSYSPWRGEAAVNAGGESSITVTLEKRP